MPYEPFKIESLPALHHVVHLNGDDNSDEPFRFHR